MRYEGFHAIRVREIHGFCRPRAFRSSFRDTETRRGSPCRGCKESESAWAETKAATARLPRGSRPYLEGFNRFSHLAGDFGKSKALPHDLRNRKVKAVTVIHRIIFVRAVVIAPRLFVKVSEQVERLNADIGSLQSSFEQAPEVLK